MCRPPLLLLLLLLLLMCLVAGPADTLSLHLQSGGSSLILSVEGQGGQAPLDSSSNSSSSSSSLPAVP
jgi:hypothetical protein